MTPQDPAAQDQPATAERKRHGMSKSPEYSTWASMLARCGNPKSPSYKNYGARGITVCPEWRESFARFFQDMGNRPVGMTLDRRDNELGYSKDNCRWATGEQQQRNKRNNRFLTAFGESMRLVEWQESTGIKVPTIIKRLKMGWTPERALGEPTKGDGKFNRGRTHCWHGHEFTEDNTRWTNGRRYCKTCVCEKARKYYNRRLTMTGVGRSGPAKQKAA